jgi:hypothetical protein
LAAVPEVAGSAAVVTTSSLFTGEVVPIPVWENAPKEINKKKTIFFIFI